MVTRKCQTSATLTTGPTIPNSLALSAWCAKTTFPRRFYSDHRFRPEEILP